MKYTEAQLDIKWAEYVTARDAMYTFMDEHKSKVKQLQLHVNKPDWDFRGMMEANNMENSNGN